MGHPSKIATCCYCSTRTLLTLDKGRHELSCANCGAPLRHLKMLPRAPVPQAAAPRRAAAKASVQMRRPDQVNRPTRKQKKRKSWLRHLAEEAFDVVEDIFD